MPICNPHIAPKNIGQHRVVQGLKEWRRSKPELFRKNVYHLLILDTYRNTFRFPTWLIKDDGKLSTLNRSQGKSKTATNGKSSRNVQAKIQYEFLLLTTNLETGIPFLTKLQK